MEHSHHRTFYLSFPTVVNRVLTPPPVDPTAVMPEAADNTTIAEPEPVETEVPTELSTEFEETDAPLPVETDGNVTDTTIDEEESTDTGVPDVPEEVASVDESGSTETEADGAISGASTARVLSALAMASTLPFFLLA